MVRAAVVLSGCGYLDGAEVRESVLALLELDRAGVEVQCFAPDCDQRDVLNHVTGEPVQETRNVLVEAARIARGEIKPLGEAQAEDFDLLVLPGGYGAAKTLSDFALHGAEARALPELAGLIRAFWEQKKPIAAICIAPAVLVAVAGQFTRPVVTIGEDETAAAAIEAMGGVHRNCPSDECVVDRDNKIVSCSAYMREDRLSAIADGIAACIREAVKLQ